MKPRVRPPSHPVPPAVSRLPTRVAALAALLALAAPSRAQSRPRPSRVRAFAELTAAEIARLDRARTVVLVPGGIVEEHGPYLPVYADGYRNERLTRDVAAAIAARPGWTAVVFPAVPLGDGPFDVVAGRAGFPGSAGVRASTVRAVFMDLADALGAQGFRWVFVVHGHGDPNHNRALDLAGDYFGATYHGLMVHLLGRAGCQPESMGPDAAGPPRALLSAADSAADADSPHAGLLESARTRFLRPDLVPDTIAAAPDVTAAGPSGWRAAAAKPDWPGYVGAPRHATAALGQWEYARERAGCTTLALRLLDGLDERTVPRYADRMRAIPPLRATLDALLAAEDSAAARQAAWLRTAPARP